MHNLFIKMNLRKKKFKSYKNSFNFNIFWSNAGLKARARCSPSPFATKIRNNFSKTQDFGPKLYEISSFRMYTLIWIHHCDPCTCLTVYMSWIMKYRRNLYPGIGSPSFKYSCGFVLSRSTRCFLSTRRFSRRSSNTVAICFLFTPWVTSTPDQA